jgi:hypothetical protein
MGPPGLAISKVFSTKETELERATYDTVKQLGFYTDWFLLPFENTPRKLTPSAAIPRLKPWKCISHPSWKKLHELAAQRAQGTDELVQDLVAGYIEVAAHIQINTDAGENKQ